MLAIGSGLACTTLPPPKTPEEALYRKRCGNCHELALPSAYSSREWKRIMNQMSTNAGLSDAQSSELLKWLESNSNDRTIGDGTTANGTTGGGTK
jgi:Dihaem cytochrome c